jgi:hypothetical protein
MPVKHDRQRIYDLHLEGKTNVQIAEITGASTPTVSRVVRAMGGKVVPEVVKAAPAFVANGIQALETLRRSIEDRAELFKELRELLADKKPDLELLQERIDAEVKLASEDRKTISAMGDLVYKFHVPAELEHVMSIIEEVLTEYGNAETVSEIIERLEADRAGKFIS